MKKIILSLVVVAALSTASCKKDYTCTCRSSNVTISTSTIHDTQSGASSTCSAQGTSNNGLTCSIN